jgi:Ca2+-binding RTX toxin-like protein
MSTNDVIYGGGESDYVLGNYGNDMLFGGSGNDTLDGGSGIDMIYGGLGDDMFVFSSAKDSFFGGAGSDVFIFNGSANLSISLFAKTNNLDVKFDSIENLTGGSGSDTLIGDSGGNVLSGGMGIDVLSAMGGDDIVYGGAGSDQIWGNSGNDVIFGGIGDDIITGDVGFDRLYGGSGNDVFRIYNSTDLADTIFDFKNQIGDNDIFYIQQSTFGAGLAKGLLATNTFKLSSSLDGDDRFYYVSSGCNGLLYFDPDGSGSKGATLLATLVGNPTLSASDIFIF